MRFTNTLRVALRALRRNTMRSILTALGIIIGVAAVITTVSIGNGAVVGSNAVVTKDIAAYAIAVGVPAKVTRMRFDEATIMRFEKFAWWDWPHELLHERLDDFRTLPAQEFLDRYEA